MVVIVVYVAEVIVWVDDCAVAVSVFVISIDVPTMDKDSVIRKIKSGMKSFLTRRAVFRYASIDIWIKKLTFIASLITNLKLN